jgi:hypothetical protein
MMYSMFRDVGLSIRLLYLFKVFFEIKIGNGLFAIVFSLLSMPTNKMANGHGASWKITVTIPTPAPDVDRLRKLVARHSFSLLMHSF